MKQCVHVGVMLDRPGNKSEVYISTPSTSGVPNARDQSYIGKES